MLLVKVYNRTYTTLKETVKGSLILSDIAFSKNMNGGQGNVTLILNKPITDTSYALGDIIKVEIYDELSKSGIDLYMGYVTKLGRKQTTTRQYIELNCLGMASLLTENKVNKAYLNKPVGQLFREIIDDINSTYGGVVLNYTLLTIPDGPLMGTGTVGTCTAAEALTTLANAAGGRYWYVDGNGTVHLMTPPITPTHYLTNQEDVESIDIQEEIQEMVNSITVYNKNDLSESASYSDAASIAAYGTKFILDYVFINGVPALTNYVTQYVNDRKDAKKQTTIVVNRDYAIETINPGDTVKVRNFEYPFDNIKIIKVDYTQDKAVLYLDQYISFGDQIKSLANT